MSEQTKTAVKQGGMNTKVRYITVTAMLSAVAFVLMYLEIAIPIMPSFIKFDFSDLPALLGSFALGPVCGVLICLIKNVLHLAFSNSMFVGELSNFILGAVFVAIAGNIYKHKKTKKECGSQWSGCSIGHGNSQCVFQLFCGLPGILQGWYGRGSHPADVSGNCTIHEKCTAVPDLL